MKKIFYLLVFVLLISGCGKIATDSMEFSLKEQEVPFTDIDEGMSTVTVTYDAMLANEYDTQIISDWASIMATGASFGYTKIIIINEVDGQKMAKITAYKSSVDAYLNGSINDTQFWESTEIESLS